MSAIADFFGRKTKPPRPQPPPVVVPPRDLTTLEVFVHDITTPEAGLGGALVSVAGGETRATNPNGTAHFDLPIGEQADFTISRPGYEDRTASAVPGPDTRVDVGMRRGVLTDPGGPHPDPLQGQVREVDGAFGDATGPRNVCALHLGDLIGQGLTFGLDHILPALDFAAASGYHVVRSWWQLHTVSPTWWDNKPAPRWDPRANPQLFAAILLAGAQRGLKWHLAAGALKDLGQHDKDSLFDCLADAVGQVGPEAFALIEGANESRDTTDETPASLERLVQRIRSRHPGILYSLTAYTGHEDREIDKEWTPSWQGFVMRHCYRGGHFHDKVRHIFSGAYEGVPVRRKHWRGEPFGTGPGVSAQDNGHELTAETMPMAGAMAAMTRCAWTFMSTPGVIYNRERLEDQPGIRETPVLLRAMPQDVGTFRTLGHSGPSKQGVRIHAVRSDAPDVRADYAIADSGRYVELIYGPPEQRKDLPQERVTWDRVVLHDCSWGRVETGRLS